MKIITITGYKGGCGKSTTSIHLATFLSKIGETVLIDGDPNRSAVQWSARGNQTLPFQVVDQRQALKLTGPSDFLLIDTPARPDSDDMRELAKGCDFMVLPTAPDVLNLQPLLMTARDIDKANYRVLLTMAPPLPNRDGETMQEELTEANIPVFRSVIRRTIGFPKAALAGVPICDLPEKRFVDAWKDYEAVGQELLEFLK